MVPVRLEGYERLRNVRLLRIQTRHITAELASRHQTAGVDQEDMDRSFVNTTARRDGQQ